MENNLPQTLQRLSQTELCRTLMSGDFRATSNGLPKTIKAATKEPPISEVMRVSGEKAILRFIEFELVKMTSLVSVGNNLNDAQVQFIAKHLVELFPNESLADFKLCFERGCIGQYGNIFRMDGIVLREWMEQYLEEKYQIIEDELMREKEVFNQPIQPETDKDWHKVWLEAVGGKDTILPITEKEVQQEGKIRPKKTEYIPSWDNVIDHKKKLNDARAKYYKEKFPDATEQEIELYLRKFEI